MQTRIQKWGNSLAIRIPKSFAAHSQIGQDSMVEMSMEDGKIILVPIEPAKKTLAQMLKKITPENIHQEADSGDPAGREAW